MHLHPVTSTHKQAPLSGTLLHIPSTDGHTPLCNLLLFLLNQWCNFCHLRDRHSWLMNNQWEIYQCSSQFLSVLRRDNRISPALLPSQPASGHGGLRAGSSDLASEMSQHRWTFIPSTWEVHIKPDRPYGRTLCLDRPDCARLSCPY